MNILNVKPISEAYSADIKHIEGGMDSARMKKMFNEVEEKLVFG